MNQRILAEGNDIHLIIQVCTQNGLNRPKGFLDKKDFESNFAFKSKKGNPLGKQELPITPNPEGTIIISTNPDLPKVGIWIMPDNSSSGEIEDFFLQMIDEHDFRLGHARNSVGELILQRPDLLSNSNRSKAEAHTWLAWQEEPGRSMGVALKSNWASPEHSLAQRLAKWFSNTFELEP